jgi:hypothetical protein
MKKRQLFCLSCITVMVLFFGIDPVYAQDDEAEGIFTKFTNTFDGYLKQETAVRLDEPDRFVKIKNSLELKYSNWLTDHIGVTVTGLAVYDAVYDVEDELEVEDEEDYRAYVDLREGFLDLTFEKVDLRIGKQQVVWGSTDGFRVTDVVNPLDLREFGLAEFLDSRIPLWIGKIDYYLTTDFSLQALIIPEMQFVEPAHAGSEYAFGPPEIPQGVVPIINAVEEPDESFENTEYGLKFSGYFEGWDFTLNYLYTWDDEPIMKKSLDPNAGTLTISPEHERMHIAGGTFATAVWDAVVRGELAVKIGKYLSVDDVTIPGMAVEKTLLNYALAFERDLFDISWLLQFFQEAVLDYEDAISRDEVDTNLTLRGSKSNERETLEFVLSVGYGVNESEFLIRPSLEYDITDSTKIKVGVDLFEGGDENTLFGQFDEKDRVYLELKYSF